MRVAAASEYQERGGHQQEINKQKTKSRGVRVQGSREDCECKELRDVVGVAALLQCECREPSDAGSRCCSTSAREARDAGRLGDVAGVAIVRGGRHSARAPPRSASQQCRPRVSAFRILPYAS